MVGFLASAHSRTPDAARVAFALSLLLLPAACGKKDKPTDDAATQAPVSAPDSPASVEGTLFEGEVRLKNLRRITHGGENAEAYFSSDGTELIFQTTRGDLECDQIYRMGTDGSNQRLVSTGDGRTTCGFILPDDSGIIYSSSHASSKACPPPVDHSKGYVWPLMADLEIYKAGPEGENPAVLAPYDGYDAEAVISPQGDRILFTSTRSGDVDIWSMDINGGDLKQLTHEEGYDGGAFFSRDGKKIVYRANHPTGPALEDYRRLRDQNLVRPSVMNLMVMNADGSDKQEILANGAANFAPYFHPDGKRIIFSSNMDDPGGRDFDLYMINIDGSGLERITYNPSFDSFPMFSYDGTKLVFASNRDGSVEGETNVFVADWVDELPAQAEDRLGKPETSRIFADAEYLASAPLQGRGIGTQGIETAAAWLEERFAMLGLQAAGDSGGFRDSFDVAIRGTLKRSALSVGGKTVATKDISPLAFSSSSTVDADAVYVGYGISSKEFAYDDYQGPHGAIDVTGKVVVLSRYEPQRHDATSRFLGVQPIRESDIRQKALQAKHRGAAAVIIVNPPAEAHETDTVIAFGDGPTDIGIPVVHMSHAAGARAFGASLEAARAQIDASGEPNSGLALPRVALTVTIEREHTTVSNIVGVLPAATPIDDRLVVVGAHYDHLGFGGDSSLRPGTKAVHHGADDNASGVAVMLELARILQKSDLSRTVVFVAFTAEESGLLGSSHFVTNGPLKGRTIGAMINLDMVGRLRDGGLHVSGVGTGEGLQHIAQAASVGLPFRMTTDPDGYGPSDHMSFYLAQVPVLAMFTGTHAEYHTPDDTSDLLNADGMAQVATYTLRIVEALTKRPTLPAYVQVQSSSGGDRGGSGGRGYGPRFGSIPAFGDTTTKGVKVSGARPDSPAAKAGLQADDVIVRFGTYDVSGLDDFTFALRQHQSGDTVEVVIERGGERQTLRATLGE